MSDSSKGALVFLWMLGVPQLIWGMTIYLFPPEGVVVTYESFLPLNEDLHGVYRPLFWCLTAGFCVSPWVFSHIVDRQTEAWRERVIRGSEERFWGCRYGLHAWYVLQGGKSIEEEIPELPLPPPGFWREAMCHHETIRICTSCQRAQRRVMDTRGCLSITDPPDYYWQDISEKPDA